MLRLECEAKQYAWGQPGSCSLVADLAQRGSGASIKPDVPYAELWMGVHPSGPSTIARSGMKLSDWLDANPLAIGAEVIKHHGTKLPFLFKVLSVDTALSIQAHPDKVLAEQLHAERPEDYKDDNHKPEMAIAVRDFEALCGFETVHGIESVLARHPELRSCVGGAACRSLRNAERLLPHEQRAVLQQAFTALMTCDSAVYVAQSGQLHERLANSQDAEPLPEKVRISFLMFECCSDSARPLPALYPAESLPSVAIHNSCFDRCSTSNVLNDLTRQGALPPQGCLFRTDCLYIADYQ